MNKLKVLLCCLQHRIDRSPYSLGILSIGSYLYNSKIGNDIDLKLLSHPVGSTLELIAKSIIDSDTDIVGFSSNIIIENVVINALKLVKKQKNNVVVIVGGPSVVTSSIDLTVKKECIDYYIVGEGEFAFKELVQIYIDKNQGKAKFQNKIKNIISKQLSLRNIAPHTTIDIDDIYSPYLSYSKSSFVDTYKIPMDHIYWETTRGCVFQCAYCSYSSMNHSFRNISLKRLEEEVKVFNKKEIKSIFITDPVIGGKKSNTKRIFSLLSKLKRKPSISILLRPEYIDDEIANYLKGANIIWIDLGLQTTNPNLSWVRKNNMPLLKEKLQILKQNCIDFNVDLIIGIPGDTIITMKESIRCVIEELYPTTIKIFPLRVYPGTVIHEMEISKGIKWINYNHSTRTVINTYSCSEQELSDMIKFSNVVVAFYRYFGNQLRKKIYRTFGFYEILFHIIKKNEYLSSDYWHVLNCPQNSYDKNICQRIWVKIKSFID